MKYVITRKNKVAILVCATLFIAVLVLVTLASFGVWYRGVFEIAAMLMGVATIQVSQRYLFSSYELIVDPDDELLNHNRLTVVRIAGKNRTSLITLPLSALTDVRPYVRTGKLKKELGVIGPRYSFCADMRPTESYLLIFNFNEENTVLRVQCDENFASELKKRMGV